MALSICIVIVGKSILSVTVTWLCVVALPVHGSHYLERAQLRLNDQIPLLKHWSVHHSYINPCGKLQFSPSGSSWGVVCLMIHWNVNFICVSHASKFGGMVMSVIHCDQKNWRTFTCGGSTMWSMWCAMARLMAVTSIHGALAFWAVPVMAAFIPVLWPWMASIWIPKTQAAMSTKMGLWPGSTSPVPAFISDVLNLICHGNF